MHDHDSASFVFAATRACHYAACLLLAAAFAFEALLAGPVVGRAKARFASWEAALPRLIIWCLPLALLSGGGWLALVTIEMSGLPPAEALKPDTLSLVWSHTHFGLVWKVRLAAWAAAALAGVAVVRVRNARTPRTLLMWIGLVVSLALCASLAWSGHALASAGGSLHLIADALHIAICAIWPATLVPLALTLAPYGLAESDTSSASYQLVGRFSAWSFCAVLVVSLTGVINARFLLASPTDLFKTPYGRVLSLKLLLFAAMLAVGALNRRLIVRGASTSKPMRSLRINVWIEIALAMGVIIAVGYLGRMSPPGNGP